MTTLSDTPGIRAAPASWPLTPIEELELHLENAGEPSLVQLETHVRTHLDGAALESALSSVLAADPVARRHLAATHRWVRRMRWAAAPAREAGLLTVAYWDSAGQLAALREGLSVWPMPLRDATVRLILAVGPERDVVILQTHHAAFDGISSLGLLKAICSAYRDRAGAGWFPPTGPLVSANGGAKHGAGIRPGTASPPATRGPARPDEAGQAAQPGQAHRGPRLAGPRGAGRVPAAARQMAARVPGVVTRIAAHTACPDRPGYGCVLRSVPVPRPARQGSGPFPTVNDLLVATLILAVDRWNAAHGTRSRRICITVPVNDRDPGRRWEGPGNQSRLIRVTTDPSQRTDAAALLAHVAAQTRAGKRQSRPGLDAASRLLAAGWAPAAIKRHTARLVRRIATPVCTDTSLVSNLGALPDPPSFSGTGQEPLWMSGPAPMPRGLGVGAVTVAGRLHLSVHYRYALLDPCAAEDFTALYIRALGELAGLPPGRLVSANRKGRLASANRKGRLVFANRKGKPA